MHLSPVPRARCSLNYEGHHLHIAILPKWSFGPGALSEGGCRLSGFSEFIPPGGPGSVFFRYGSQDRSLGMTSGVREARPASLTLSRSVDNTETNGTGVKRLKQKKMKTNKTNKRTDRSW